MNFLKDADRRSKTDPYPIASALPLKPLPTFHISVPL